MGMSPGTPAERYHFRFHEPHRHLASIFGDNWFGAKAEAFARFFGTPTFLHPLVIAAGVLTPAIRMMQQALRRAPGIHPRVPSRRIARPAVAGTGLALTCANRPV
jgi:hypothetical protein